MNLLGENERHELERLRRVRPHWRKTALQFGAVDYFGFVVLRDAETAIHRIVLYDDDEEVEAEDGIVDSECICYDMQALPWNDPPTPYFAVQHQDLAPIPKFNDAWITTVVWS
jgi:hypothetical protein